MSHVASDDDLQFRRAFESCQLKPKDLDHAANVRLAHVYFRDLPDPWTPTACFTFPTLPHLAIESIREIHVQKFILALLTASLLSQDSAAQQIKTYERRLLPIQLEVTEGIPGANGSLWRTFLVGRNESDERVRVVQNPSSDCQIGGCPPEDAGPRISFIPQIFAASQHPGAFVYLEKPGADKVFLNLRVQDLSRQSQTWGTEIPVLRERDFYSSAFQLLNTPTSSEFRTNLRIYDFDGRNGTEARVTIFPVSDNSVLSSEVVRLIAPASVGGEPSFPAYAEITSLTSKHPQIVNARRVRIEIEPMTPGAKIWAFVAITNNDTQHVTLITPQ